MVADAERRVREDLRNPRAGAPTGRLAIGAAAALFAAIFALRVTVDDPPALIANFYTVPTAVLAVAYGIRGGIVGAVVSMALVFVWHLLEPVELHALGYASRAAVVILIGTVVGYFSERLRVDIARREEAERELALRAADLAHSNDRLEQAVRRLGAMATMARAAGTETDLAGSLTRIVEQAEQLSPATALAVDVGTGTQALRVAESGRWDRGQESGTAVLRVPLSHRDEPLGTMLVAGGGAEESPDADLIAAVAATASTAIATARSVAAERVRDVLAAAEQERRRWAWELHDQTLQGLVGLRVLLSSALRAGDPAALARAAAEALEELQVETSNLKHLIAELRPAALDELGLGAALSDLCHRVASTSGVEIGRELALDEPGLPPEVAAIVYRVAQEALTNVGKHADAEHAAVTVRQEAGMLHLEVADDGRGFDPRTPHSGFGLRGMRERVELAGGVLRIDTGDAGTRVCATISLQAVSRPGPARQSLQTTR